MSESNPYAEAWREWNDRYHELVGERRWWEAVAGAELVLVGTRGPLDLGPTGRPVVRLNRRVIYVVGAILVGAFVIGLVAIRAQGTRVSEACAQRRVALRPRSQTWFEAVPDQESAPHSSALDHLPSPSTSVSSPRLAAAQQTQELEGQRQQGSCARR